MAKGRIKKVDGKGLNQTIPKALKNPDGKVKFDFSKFTLTPQKQSDFNNFFKNESQFTAIAWGLLGVCLPKVSQHTFSQLTHSESKQMHFHILDNEHCEKVKKILSDYSFSTEEINQLVDENSIFEFSAIMGHVYPSRLICSKIDDIIYPLFLDTNHHIYFDKKYGDDTLFYEFCPAYQCDQCKYMPDDCFAVSYLDEDKLNETFENNWKYKA